MRMPSATCTIVADGIRSVRRVATVQSERPVWVTLKR